MSDTDVVDQWATSVGGSHPGAREAVEATATQLREQGWPARAADVAALARHAEDHPDTGQFLRTSASQLWPPTLPAAAPTTDAADDGGAATDPRTGGLSAAEPSAGRPHAVWVFLGVGLVVGALLRLIGHFIIQWGKASESEDSLAVELLMRLVPVVAWSGAALALGWYRRMRFWGAPVAVVGIVAISLIPWGYAAASGGTSFTNEVAMLAFAYVLALTWLLVGWSHTGGRWRDTARRMNFIRFNGEFVIMGGLLVSGVGAVVGTMTMLFYLIGQPLSDEATVWLMLLPSCAAAMIAVWLADLGATRRLAFAPVIAKVLSPLMLLLMVAFTITLPFAQLSDGDGRSLLIAATGVTILAFGLLAFVLSARDDSPRMGAFDWISVGLAAATVILDLFVLTHMGLRIGDFGWTPNRTMAAILTIILAVNLVGTLVHYGRFIAKRATLMPLVQWQTVFLTVFGLWSLVVIVVWPLVFGLPG